MNLEKGKWFVIPVEDASGGSYNVRVLGMNSSNNIHMGDYNGGDLSGAYLHAKGNQFNFASTYFGANANNTTTLGTPDKLWSTVYSKTGSINTSDRTKKHDINDISEVYEQLFMKFQPKSFMFDDGDRVHIGGISQDVEEAMNELGIATEKFAGFCKDVRYEYTEYSEDDGEPIGSSKKTVVDESGNIIYD